MQPQLRGPLGPNRNHAGPAMQILSAQGSLPGNFEPTTQQVAGHPHQHHPHHHLVAAAATSSAPLSSLAVSAGRLPGSGVVRLQSAQAAPGADGVEVAMAPMVSTRSMRMAATATGAGYPAGVQGGGGASPDMGADKDMLRQIEELRKTVNAQEKRITDLNKELASVRESEGKLRMEADVARAEAARVVDELRREQTARERWEGIAAGGHSQDGSPGGRPGQSRVAGDKASPSSPPRRSASAKPQRAGSPQAQPSQASARSPRLTGPQANSHDTLSSIPVAKGRDGKTSASNLRRGQSPTSPQSAHQPQQQQQSANVPQKSADDKRPAQSKDKAKDEVDVSLQDFLERSDSNLTFKRLNKGFYTVKRPGERETMVEVSIVNGKLMARLESSATDAGWNNGKLGPIEKFASFFGNAPS